MAEKDKSTTSPSVNPATGVKTPSLPTKTTRNDGHKIVNNSPIRPQGGSKK